MTFFLGAVNLQDSALCGSLLRHYVDQAGLKNAEILTVSNAAFLPYSEPFLCNSAQSPIFVFASPKGPLSLDDPGAPFGRSKKASKTEIPAALESIYKRFGTAFPSAIQSDHSIALWDQTTKTLVLSRDRFGTKPLYFAFLNETLIFSNRLACIFGFPGISRDLDATAILDFMLFGKHNKLDSCRTPFREIRSVRPSFSLRFDRDGLSSKKYWEFPSGVSECAPKKDREIIDVFSQKLSTAIDRRLDGGKTSIAMSGGLDSTTTAAVLTGSEFGREIEIDAFTVCSSERSEEFRYAKLVADHLGIRHHLFSDSRFGLDCSRINGLIPTENPFPEKYSQLQRYTAERCCTVLTGGAADNLLAYSPVRVLSEIRAAGLMQAIRVSVLHYRIFGRRPAIRARNVKLTMRPTILYPAWLNRDFAKDLGAEDRWANFWEQVPDVANQRHPISNLAMTCADWDRDPGNFDLNFRPARREDPFFDQDLIEYVVSLASLPWFHRKTLIRSLGQRLLPPAVVKRKKTPPEDLFDCNLRKIDLARFNRISSSPILTSIVDLSKWDWLHPGMKKDLRYVNFRVLALSRWLEEMEGHSVSGLAGYS